MKQFTGVLAHLNASTVIFWACVALAIFIAIWVCAYVARVATEFGKGIFVVLAIVLGIGLYLGPWFLTFVHAVGIR